MDLLDYTPDFPRESLYRRVINYSPSMCLALIFLVVYPVTGGYLWTNLCVSYIGLWGWTPTVMVMFATIVGMCIFSLRANRSPHLR